MIQNATDFVAARVFPNIPVSKQSDRYYVYDRGEFNRDEMEERAPATESAGGGYKLDNTPTYYAKKYSFHHDIPDEVRANADAALNVDRDGVTYVTQKALLKRETLFASTYFSTGVWGNEVAGVSASPSGAQVLQWNDANSNPIEDVRTSKRVIRQSTGFEPNKMVLSREVYDKLVDHPDIIDRVKYGQTAGRPAMAGVDALKALFEIEDILVMNAIVNTAKEGQTAAHSFIGGKHAMLCHSASTPGLLTPSAGYTFSWTGLMGNGVQGNRIKTLRLDLKDADRIEIDMCFDMRRVAGELGYFFSGIVA
jgi:hypothetical protein